MVNQLKFVFPVRDFWVVMIKVLSIIMKVGQWRSVIRHDAFAAIQFWRAVVADDVQDDLDASFIERFDQPVQRFTSLQRGRFPFLTK